jgi:hypothetical protein
VVILRGNGAAQLRLELPRLRPYFGPIVIEKGGNLNLALRAPCQQAMRSGGLLRPPAWAGEAQVAGEQPGEPP